MPNPKTFTDEDIKRIARAVVMTEKLFRNDKPKRKQWNISNDASTKFLIHCDSTAGITGRTPSSKVPQSGTCKFVELSDGTMQLSDEEITVLNPFVDDVLTNGSRIGYCWRDDAGNYWIDAHDCNDDATSGVFD